MKIRSNPKIKNVHGSGNLIKADIHSWRRPAEGSPKNMENSPIVGYSYQPFLGENLFTSLLRPMDISNIEDQVRSGNRLHVHTLLHFADCYAEEFETLLAYGNLATAPFMGFSLAQVALMHISAGNFALSRLICEHIFRQGNTRQVLHDGAKTFVGNEKVGLHFLEQAMPIMDAAERTVLHEKLDRDLAKKSTLKQVKI